MIDVKGTIYKSINDAFGMLRYQAKDDPKAFRSILEVSMVDYMLHWASGLLEPQEHLQKLVDLRHDLLMCNPALKLQHLDNSTAYVNVNTPQSNADWKRVWDAHNVLNPHVDTIYLSCKEDTCTSGPTSLIKVNKITINNNIIP
jgi:hypothetical protein